MDFEKSVKVFISIVFLSLYILLFLESPAHTEESLLQSSEETLMEELINQERSINNLLPLKVDSVLTTLCREHSQEMSLFGYVSEHSPQNGSPRERTMKSWIGDYHSVAFVGKDMSVEKVFQSLWENKDFTDEMLSGENTHVGIGIVRDTSGKRLVTVHFLARLLEFGFGVDRKSGPALSKVEFAYGSPTEKLTRHGISRKKYLKFLEYKGSALPDDHTGDVTYSHEITTKKDSTFSITVERKKPKGSYCQVIYGRDHPKEQYKIIWYFRHFRPWQCLRLSLSDAGPPLFTTSSALKLMELINSERKKQRVDTLAINFLLSYIVQISFADYHGQGSSDVIALDKSTIMDKLATVALHDYQTYIFFVNANSCSNALQKCKSDSICRKILFDQAITHIGANTDTNTFAVALVSRNVVLKSHNANTGELRGASKKKYLKFEIYESTVLPEQYEGEKLYSAEATTGVEDTFSHTIQDMCRIVDGRDRCSFVVWTKDTLKDDFEVTNFLRMAMP